MKYFTLHQLKPYSGRFLFFVVFEILSIMFTMATVLSLADFLKIIFETEATAIETSADNYQLNYLLQQFYLWLISFGKSKAIVMFSVILFSLYALKNVFSYCGEVQISIIRSKVVRNIRNTLFNKTMRLSMDYFGHTRKGDILSRFSNDIVEYEENIIKAIRQLIIAVINVFLYFIMLLYINAKLTIFVLCLFPVIALVISRITRHLRRNSATLQQKTSFLMSLIEETLSGLRIVKAYTAIEFSNDRFRTYNRSYTRLRNKVYRRVDLASPVSDFMANCIVMGILLFGAYLVFNNDSGLSPELFITYIMMFVLLINPAKDIATAVSSLKKGHACTERLSGFINETEKVVDVDNPIEFKNLKEGIRYDHVSFSYNGSDVVLDDITLDINKGRTIALVGHSGSGKSTMVDLLSRFYNCTSGSILIDGKPIEHYSIADIRNSIGIVSQDTILFNDTVFNNISFGMKDVTPQQVEDAAKIANAHDFISEMPQGYQTVIGDRGSRLSGGQRQRISIARAILRNPDILILDEATSALDTENERLVQNAMNNVLVGRTAIVIAHRLSTIVNADMIVVLDNGKIVEQGTHKELSANKGGLYHKLCTMQYLDK